jgi:uncharacterized protein (TIGR02391 family)
MSLRKPPDPPPLEPRQFTSVDEINRGVKKLERRIDELMQVDMAKAVVENSGADNVAASNIRETIRDVFGTNSPEFREHEHLRIWAGPMYLNMGRGEVVEAKERGKRTARTVLEGLIGRLRERQEELATSEAPQPSKYFTQLNLHPRIAEVATDLFMDGHHWEAVFAASKALLNYVKDRSQRHDLDGANLMRTVFSRNTPILAFNDLKEPTELDEQEGMMHLFEGAVLAIRNPGGHTFPEGSAQRAVEYINFLSLLAYKVQEARKA